MSAIAAMEGWTFIVAPPKRGFEACSLFIDRAVYHAAWNGASARIARWPKPRHLMVVQCAGVMPPDFGPA